MLTDDIKEEIRQRLKAVADAMPGFRARSGQRTLIAEVAKALGRCPDPTPDGGTPAPRPPIGATLLCAQGGTGIGKSLAYALPGVILAKRKGKHLVIATATVALQEQLISKDLPRFFEAAGLSVSVELAKGRTRYVCDYRLRSVAAEMRQDAMFEKEDRPGRPDLSSAETRALIETLAAEFAEGRWDGDRDQRPGIPDELWPTLTADRAGCLGQHCPRVRQCAQIASRKRIKSADVVVTNHDMVLADLVMGGGKILPAPGDAFYVFDEGQHLPDKAVSSFAANHLIGGARRLMERLPAFGRAMAGVLGPGFRESADEIAKTSERLAESLGEAFSFFDSLSQLKPTEKTPAPRLEMQESYVPDEFQSLGQNLRDGTKRLADLVQKGLAGLADHADDPARRALVEKLVADGGFYGGRLDEIFSAWNLFMLVPSENRPPIAKWVETVPGRRSVDYRLCVSPVLAGAALRKLLWEKAAGAVVTSATLTAMGEFKDFLYRAGLSGYSDVTCVTVPSPFDYPVQGTIEIPQMRAIPQDVATHTPEVGERVEAMIEGGPAGQGLLVLFTSRMQMQAVAARLSTSAREQVQLQGDGSKASIILEHKARIDRGETSAIFGLESFAEGVDLVGRYCSRVVITRLPFDVPDDPVLKALTTWIENRGGKPFFEVLVPAAARRLEQRVGRLIRTETDTGVVTVLDMRLWDKQYGRMMLRGLPPFRLVVKGKEVRL